MSAAHRTVAFVLGTALLGTALLGTALLGAGSLAAGAARTGAEDPPPERGRPRVPDARIRTAPITIAASTVGDFRRGSSWYLSVNSAGRAELVVARRPGETRKELTVSAEQLRALREALVRERFFELDGGYGERVPSGSTESLTITVGADSRTVDLHFLMGLLRGETRDLEGPARALRVWLIVRGWVDDPDAFDRRPWDHRVLDAAG